MEALEALVSGLYSHPSPLISFPVFILDMICALLMYYLICIYAFKAFMHLGADEDESDLEEADMMKNEDILEKIFGYLDPDDVKAACLVSR